MRPMAVFTGKGPKSFSIVLSISVTIAIFVALHNTANGQLSDDLDVGELVGNIVNVTNIPTLAPDATKPPSTSAPSTSVSPTTVPTTTTTTTETTTTTRHHEESSITKSRVTSTETYYTTTNPTSTTSTTEQHVSPTSRKKRKRRRRKRPHTAEPTTTILTTFPTTLSSSTTTSRPIDSIATDLPFYDDEDEDSSESSSHEEMVSTAPSLPNQESSDMSTVVAMDNILSPESNIKVGPRSTNWSAFGENQFRVTDIPIESTTSANLGTISEIPLQAIDDADDEYEEGEEGFEYSSTEPVSETPFVTDISYRNDKEEAKPFENSQLETIDDLSVTESTTSERSFPEDVHLKFTESPTLPTTTEYPLNFSTEQKLTMKGDIDFRVSTTTTGPPSSAPTTMKTKLICKRRVKKCSRKTGKCIVKDIEIACPTSTTESPNMAAHDHNQTSCKRRVRKCSRKTGKCHIKIIDRCNRHKNRHTTLSPNSTASSPSLTSLSPPPPPQSGNLYRSRVERRRERLSHKSSGHPITSSSTTTTTTSTTTTEMPREPWEPVPLITEIVIIETTTMPTIGSRLTDIPDDDELDHFDDALDFGHQVTEKINLLRAGLAVTDLPVIKNESTNEIHPSSEDDDDERQMRPEIISDWEDMMEEEENDDDFYDHFWDGPSVVFRDYPDQLLNNVPHLGDPETTTLGTHTRPDFQKIDDFLLIENEEKTYHQVEKLSHENKKTETTKLELPKFSGDLQLRRESTIELTDDDDDEMRAPPRVDEVDDFTSKLSHPSIKLKFDANKWPRFNDNFNSNNTMVTQTKIERMPLLNNNDNLRTRTQDELFQPTNEVMRAPARYQESGFGDNLESLGKAVHDIDLRESSSSPDRPSPSLVSVNETETSSAPPMSWNLDNYKVNHIALRTGKELQRMKPHMDENEEKQMRPNFLRELMEMMTVKDRYEFFREYFPFLNTTSQDKEEYPQFRVDDLVLGGESDNFSQQINSAVKSFDHPNYSKNRMIELPRLSNEIRLRNGSEGQQRYENDETRITPNVNLQEIDELSQDLKKYQIMVENNEITFPEFDKNFHIENNSQISHETMDGLVLNGTDDFYEVPKSFQDPKFMIKPMELPRLSKEIKLATDSQDIKHAYDKIKIPSSIQEISESFQSLRNYQIPIRDNNKMNLPVFKSFDHRVTTERSPRPRNLFPIQDIEIHTGQQNATELMNKFARAPPRIQGSFDSGPLASLNGVDVNLLDEENAFYAHLRNEPIPGSQNVTREAQEKFRHAIEEKLKSKTPKESFDFHIRDLMIGKTSKSESSPEEDLKNYQSVMSKDHIMKEMPTLTRDIILTNGSDDLQITDMSYSVPQIFHQRQKATRDQLEMPRFSKEIDLSSVSSHQPSYDGEYMIPPSDTDRKSETNLSSFGFDNLQIPITDNNNMTSIREMSEDFNFNKSPKTQKILEEKISSLKNVNLRQEKNKSPQIDEVMRAPLNIHDLGDGGNLETMTNNQFKINSRNYHKFNLYDDDREHRPTSAKMDNERWNLDTFQSNPITLSEPKDRRRFDSDGAQYFPQKEEPEASDLTNMLNSEKLENIQITDHMHEKLFREDEHLMSIEHGDGHSTSFSQLPAVSNEFHLMKKKPPHSDNTKEEEEVMRAPMSVQLEGSDYGTDELLDISPPIHFRIPKLSSSYDLDQRKFTDPVRKFKPKPGPPLLAPYLKDFDLRLPFRIQGSSAPTVMTTTTTTTTSRPVSHRRGTTKTPKRRSTRLSTTTFMPSTIPLRTSFTSSTTTIRPLFSSRWTTTESYSTAARLTSKRAQQVKTRRKKIIHKKVCKKRITRCNQHGKNCRDRVVLVSCSTKKELYTEDPSSVTWHYFGPTEPTTIEQGDENQRHEKNKKKACHKNVRVCRNNECVIEKRPLPPDECPD